MFNLAVAIVAMSSAISLTSCDKFFGNKDNNQNDPLVTDSLDKDTLGTDTLTADTTAAPEASNTDDKAPAADADKAPAADDKAATPAEKK